MDNKSIYHIQSEHLQLMQQIEDNEGELTPELSAQLDLTKDEFETKAVSYGYLMKSINNDNVTIKCEIDRLSALLKSKERLEDELKFRLTEAMIRLGYEKVSKNNLTLSLRKSEVVSIDADAVISKEFQSTKISVTPDKTALKAAIKDGRTIEGVRIIENQNLQIK